MAIVSIDFSIVRPHASTWVTFGRAAQQTFSPNARYSMIARIFFHVNFVTSVEVSNNNALIPETFSFIIC